MKRVLRMSAALVALGVIVLMSGYFHDHHRCKQVNYENAGHEMPKTWLISAKQCLAVANAIRLRSYARTS